MYTSILGLESHIFILLSVLTQTYQRGQSQWVDMYPSGNYHHLWCHMGELSKVAHASPGRIKMTEYRRALAARRDISVPSIDTSTLRGGEGGGGGILLINRGLLETRQTELTYPTAQSRSRIERHLLTTPELVTPSGRRLSHANIAS